MKIAVCDIQPTNFPVGGQQIEIVNYAETFAELGHDVDLYFNPESSPLWEQILEAAGARAITTIKPLPDKFTMALGRSYDLYFSGYPWIDLPDGAPVVSWWIDPYVLPGVLYGRGEWPRPWETYPGLVGIWTLSGPMRDALVRYRGVPDEWRGEIEVIPAPIDYRAFRMAARPVQMRDIDLLFVGRDDPGKHPEVFVDFVTALGREHYARMYLPEWPGRPRRSALRKLPDYAVIGAARADIAAAMGRAKVLFLPSDSECASLVIYEAMNAGCCVVASDVGSVRWQLGETHSVGKVFPPGDWDEARKQVLSALRGAMIWPDWVEKAMARGMVFDRITAKDRIATALEMVKARA